MARPNRKPNKTKSQPEAAHRKDAAAAVRAAQALDLRLQGYTYEEIARECGYAGRQGAQKAVQRELQRTVQEPADQLRELEARRLNKLYQVAYRQAIKGGEGYLWAVDRCIKITEQRRALLGLDVPRDTMAGAGLALVSVPIAADVLEAL